MASWTVLNGALESLIPAIPRFCISYMLVSTFLQAELLPTLSNNLISLRASCGGAASILAGLVDKFQSLAEMGRPC
jgi:hypothetical protein